MKGVQQIQVFSVSNYDKFTVYNQFLLERIKKNAFGRSAFFFGYSVERKRSASDQSVYRQVHNLKKTSNFQSAT